MKEADIMVNIPVALPYEFAFLLLTYLCYLANEIFHHLVGATLSGGFGTMTFTTYEPRPPCASG